MPWPDSYEEPSKRDAIDLYSVIVHATAEQNPHHLVGCPDWAVLIQVSVSPLRNTLEDGDRRRLAEHLTGCPGCQRQYDIAVSVQEAFNDFIAEKALALDRQMKAARRPPFTN